MNKEQLEQIYEYCDKYAETMVFHLDNSDWELDYETQIYRINRKHYFIFLIKESYKPNNHKPYKTEILSLKTTN